MIRVALLLLVIGCHSNPGDRLYTPIDCEEGTADCDGSLETGCESPGWAGNCCGEVCLPNQMCERGECVLYRPPPPETDSEPTAAAE